MKKNKLTFLLVLTLMLSGSIYSSCESDYIRSKASDGSVLILGSGSSWEIDSIDRINTRLWFAMDDVLICDDGYIIHKNDGEKVGARLIR